jgi:hypothetical protein
LDKENVQCEIENLRHELNEKFKLHSTITPELLALSMKLDHLLNKWYHSQE